MKRRQVQFGC